ncbi:MAG: ABC transporter substrate-binding protein, partial [Chloroflexota bacterium]
MAKNSMLMRLGAAAGSVAMIASVGFGAASQVSAAHAPAHFHGTVKVGVVAAFTGNEGFLGPDLMQGIKAAASEINSAGGILGKKVILDSADTAGDAVDSVPAFRKMVSVD